MGRMMGRVAGDSSQVVGGVIMRWQVLMQVDHLGIPALGVLKEENAPGVGLSLSDDQTVGTQVDSNIVLVFPLGQFFWLVLLRWLPIPCSTR
jgi:hypothetical protein